MKALVLTLLVFGASFTSMAQRLEKQNPELVALIKTLPTLQEVLKQIQFDNPGVKILVASLDPMQPTATNRNAYPTHDYGYVEGDCAYVAHAYRHTILGIPYGPVYYVPELVGCI